MHGSVAGCKQASCFPAWIHKGGNVIYHFTAKMLITTVNVPYILFPLQSLIYSPFDYSICLVAEDINTHTHRNLKRSIKNQHPVSFSFSSHRAAYKINYSHLLSTLNCQPPVFSRSFADTCSFQEQFVPTETADLRVCALSKALFTVVNRMDFSVILHVFPLNLRRLNATWRDWALLAYF